jgi:hypothetical protein
MRWLPVPEGYGTVLASQSPELAIDILERWLDRQDIHRLKRPGIDAGEEP